MLFVDFFLSKFNSVREGQKSFFVKVSVDVKSSENGQFSIPISLAVILGVKAKIFVSNRVQYSKRFVFKITPNEGYL